MPLKILALGLLLAIPFVAPAAASAHHYPAPQEAKKAKPGNIKRQKAMRLRASLSEARSLVAAERKGTWACQLALGRSLYRSQNRHQATVGLDYLRWMQKLWHGRRAACEKEKARLEQHPKWIALRLLKGDREQWGCLMSIVWVENRTMDPTLDYGGGHGNVDEAYGIPQANPGYKMRSAGPDWRTNPETQLRWMIGYCRARYGSVCGAAYHRRANGMY